jgi:protein translocase SEC61 complex gamma subunit
MKIDLIGKFKTFRENSKHVMSVSYKPGMVEFSKTAKIILFGILGIGLLGFIISLIIGFLTGSSI